MREQSVRIRNPQQSVNYPAVAQVNAARLDQAFAYICMPRRQTTQKKEINYEVYVAHHGLNLCADAARQFTRI